MHTINSFCFLALVLYTGVFVAQSTCHQDLLIDDFADWNTKKNSLGEYTGDDGTMARTASLGPSLQLTPSSQYSYLRTDFGCITAKTSGYISLTFPISLTRSQGTKGSFVLELHSSTTCVTDDVRIAKVKIEGVTEATKVVNVALEEFELGGASLEAVRTVVWREFGQGGYEIGEIKLKCGRVGGGGQATTGRPTSAVVTRTVINGPSTTGKVPIPSATGVCKPLLVDDWQSQSRLTFMNYNALLEASYDDGTMESIIVSKNRVTLTPKAGGGSYFYSQFDCVSAASRYGGISLRIKAAAGTTFAIDIQSSSTCDPEKGQSHVLTSAQLGWTFSGSEKLYSLSFNKFPNLDITKLVAVVFQEVTKPITLGPISFYCGSIPSDYPLPTFPSPTYPTATIPATTATAAVLIIDRFTSASTNTLNFWHGSDAPEESTLESGKLTIRFSDPDYAFYTQLSNGCRDLTPYRSGYLHIAFSGSAKFSVALQQHNSACNSTIAPYPETWDSLPASRYLSSSKTEIFIPLSHFSILQARTIGIALKSFTEASINPTIFTLVEIVPTIPRGILIPTKVPTAPLFFACTRPNSFAFAIDDGIPAFAPEVMQTIHDAGIKVTFFTVGSALLDPKTNLSSVYSQALREGHQIALHSYTHPKMESLPELADIDWEITEDIRAVTSALGPSAGGSKYFRPPFGTEGARFRERLAALVPGSKVVGWSVDVEDWLWGESGSPEKQMEAFRRDVEKGGNLVVMHYLFPSTVGMLREFIEIAKGTGKRLMRVDQCLEDPEAPPL